MSTPVRYGEHTRIAPGTACELCGTAPGRPMTDHCHKHGWVRGVLCSPCNVLMAFIDRRMSPGKSSLVQPLTLAAAVSYAANCPQCEPFEVSDLGGTGRFGMRPPAVNTIKITLRIPDDLYAQIVAAAEADQRSLNNEIVVLATQALQARNG